MSLCVDDCLVCVPAKYLMFTPPGQQPTAHKLDNSWSHKCLTFNIQAPTYFRHYADHLQRFFKFGHCRPYSDLIYNLFYVQTEHIG